MKEETTIGIAVRVAGVKAKYDAACKKLLSFTEVLSWILKDCAKEYRECSVKEIATQFIEGEPQVNTVALGVDETNATPMIRGEQNEDVTLTEGNVAYDIRFSAISPINGQRILIDLEAQNDFRPGYSLAKRAAYYEGRMISAQKGVEFQNSHYDKLKKVYSIWVCMEPPAEFENSITVLFTEQKILRGQLVFEPWEYDLVTTVVICLGDPESEKATGVLRLLAVLLSATLKTDEKKRILETEFGIAMTREMEREVEGMCNLSDGIERKGIKKGIEIGKAEGMSLLNLLNRKLIFDGRMDDLEKATIDETYQQKLLEEYSLISV